MRRRIEKGPIIDAIVERGGNIDAAARALAFNNRANLRRAMRNLGIDRVLVGDVLIIEDRTARVVGCQDRRPA